MSDARNALGYLLSRSTVNRARVWFRRVITPRYAAAFLVGAGYLYLVLGQHYPGPTPTAIAASGSNDIVPFLYELLIVFSAILTWVVGAAEPAIVFTPADIQMLFPAPVSRRALVQYKLVQAQLPILFTVFVWRMIFRRTTPALALGRGTAVWVIVTTLYLHRVGASFVKVSAAQRGLSGIRRNAIPITVVVLALATLAWGVADALPAMQAGYARGSFEGALAALRATPQARIVLWPFDVLLAPMLAPTPAARLRAMGWAVLLMVACYVWVIRTAVGFEEAAMQSAERLAARIARLRGQSTVPLRAWRPLFRLAAAGRPWGAIVWKNVTAFQRLASPRRTLFFAVFAVVLASVWMRTSATAASMIAGIAGGGTLWLAFFGAIAVRADLQQDMLKLPLLRTYPIRGSALVAAEIGSSLLVITALQWLLLLCAIIGAQFMPLPRNQNAAAIAAGAWPMLVALVIALPAVTGLRVAVANAWAVLFPGWVQLGPTRTAGIEAIGANMLTVFGSLIIHALLMVIPGALAAGVLLSVHSVGRVPWMLVPAAIAFTAMGAVELWLLATWLGRVLSRTDPSAVDAALT